MRYMGTQGMVASPHYLATETGVSILRRGGSAIDAAIATNAVLAVVTPHLCGIGGDLFALVCASGDQVLAGLNGSGRAPEEATPERVRELAGGDHMPQRGPLPITVPGCVEAWGRLHDRYGRLAFADLLTNAIRYAEEGFPVTSVFARNLQMAAPLLHPATPAHETFLPGGRSLHEGEILRQPRLARTLRAIAQDGPDTYYRGPVGAEIVRSLRAIGGLISAHDLDEHRSEWVEPLSVRYRDVVVYELPPNTQGIVALEMLAMLDHLSPELVRDEGVTFIHTLAEIARLAYADRETYLTDREHMAIDPVALLDETYVRARVALVQDRVSGATGSGQPGDTVYLCAVDAEGNLVSLIESNYMGIGSGVMAGETGIMLHNRGAWFSLDSAHTNVIAPRKRTMHTLIPALAYRGGRPWLVFGSMGGSTQPQIHVQLLTRLVDQGIALDDAIAAPRFDAMLGLEDGLPVIELENRFGTDVIDGLRKCGHAVRVVEPYSSQMGHAHAIQILDNGVYVGAADPRTTSLALGY